MDLHLNLSAMRELAAGLQTASPRAMPTLSTTSCQNCVANPITTQQMEKMMMPGYHSL